MSEHDWFCMSCMWAWLLPDIVVHSRGLYDLFYLPFNFLTHINHLQLKPMKIEFPRPHSFVITEIALFHVLIYQLLKSAVKNRIFIHFSIYSPMVNWQNNTIVRLKDNFMQCTVYILQCNYRLCLKDIFIGL